MSQRPLDSEANSTSGSRPTLHAAPGDAAASASMTHSSLIRGLQDNQQSAWRQLVHLYGPLVFHWCGKMGLKHADAADVMQEVFFSVCRAADRFDVDRRRGSFRGWLWTITRRKVIDLLRRRPVAAAAGGTVALQRIEELADPYDDNSQDASERSIVLRVYRRGLELIESEFEPRSWQAFYRSAVNEEATADIAADLGMTPAAVRKAKSRVLRRLREALGDQPG